MNADELADGHLTTPDFRRDQWGRPSIMQPDGKRKGYTRCSSAAKTIEDTFNLEKWARRNIAYGMAYDPSLVARIIAIGGEPSTWKKPEKDQVNEILDAADAVAKAHKRADMGTAVHHMTHRLDRGEEVIAGPYQADIDAYHSALKQHGLTPVPELIECRMVNDDLEMAGTADRILPNGGEFHRIADIKTGATIDFGGLGWAAQLAAYAGGLIYDPVKEQRLPTPPIDRDIGLIIHLPAGEGRCDIYEVNIERGLAAARLANDIRAIRKDAKTWIKPVANIGPPARDPTDAGRRARLLERYRTFSDVEKMAYCDHHVDPNDLDEIERVLNKVDRFNVTVEPAAPPPLRLVEPLPEAPFEGDAIIPKASVTALQLRFDRLEPSAQAWTSTLVVQGRKTYDFRIKDHPTERRYSLYKGILDLAEWSGGGVDDVVKTICNHVVGIFAKDTPPGEALGCLNVKQANQFAWIAYELTHDRYTVSDDGTGTLRLTAV